MVIEHLDISTYTFYMYSANAGCVCTSEHITGAILMYIRKSVRMPNCGLVNHSHFSTPLVRIYLHC